VLVIGGTMWLVALSYAVGGVAGFANGRGNTRPTLFALLALVDALLQAIGAMTVAATDADLHILAKKHPRSAFTFPLTSCLARLARHSMAC
jgi:hypothetical protein